MRSKNAWHLRDDYEQTESNCGYLSEQPLTFFGNSDHELTGFDCVYQLEDGDTGGGPDACVSQVDDPGEDIECSSQGDCTISERIVFELNAAPEFGLEQYGVAEFVTSPYAGLVLRDVGEGDIIYLLGFRTDDIILEINDMPTSNQGEVEDAMLSLQSEVRFEVELRRSGTTLVTYEYELDS